MAELVRISARPVDVGSHVAALRGVRREGLAGLEQAAYEVGDAAEQAMREAALKGETLALERSVRQVRSGRGGRVTVSVVAGARNPKTGFDYTAVTRFGHRGRIYPRSDRAPASVVATRRARATGAAAALRFTIGGRVVYARSTRGFHPASDWSDRGVPPTLAAMATATQRLGAALAARWRQ